MTTAAVCTTPGCPWHTSNDDRRCNGCRAGLPVTDSRIWQEDGTWMAEDLTRQGCIAWADTQAGINTALEAARVDYDEIFGATRD